VFVSIERYLKAPAAPVYLFNRVFENFITWPLVGNSGQSNRQIAYYLVTVVNPAPLLAVVIYLPARLIRLQIWFVS
jgi:hypothetical protein